MEKTDKIKVRCSCGDSSLVCENCFIDYWSMDDCPYRYDNLPKFKCPICKTVDKRQQLTRIFDELKSCFNNDRFISKFHRSKIHCFLYKKLKGWCTKCKCFEEDFKNCIENCNCQSGCCIGHYRFKTGYYYKNRKVVKIKR
tara:strand:- start:503 stop:925 length:423 start_codon:yes stop_codon:yes gene_type:complete